MEPQTLISTPNVTAPIAALCSMLYDKAFAKADNLTTSLYNPTTGLELAKAGYRIRNSVEVVRCVTERQLLSDLIEISEKLKTFFRLKDLELDIFAEEPDGLTVWVCSTMNMDEVSEAYDHFMNNYWSKKWSSIDDTIAILVLPI